MLAQKALPEDSDEDTPIQEMKVTFTRIQDALEGDDFFAKIRTQGLLKPVGERQISNKMREKLLNWL